MAEPRFRVNTELTAAKVFDDEAIVINTATGRYYDLEGTGALVWSTLGDGASAHDIAVALSEVFDVSEVAALGDVDRLIERLLAEDLILVDTDVTTVGASASRPRGSRHRYQPPTLATYTDMEDLLAADPPLPAAYAPPSPAPASAPGSTSWPTSDGSRVHAG